MPVDSPVDPTLPAAVRAFDAIAPRFDERFAGWLSVQAQRRAVRRELLQTFPAGSRLLELGGGTGADAVFLAERGRDIVLTDGAPRMLAAASDAVRHHGLTERITVIPVTLEALAEQCDRLLGNAGPFDGAYSNFAAVNCVADLAPVGQAIANLVKPGGRVVLVVFGPFPPGEMVVQLLRGRVRAAFRRLADRKSVV